MSPGVGDDDLRAAMAAEAARIRERAAAHSASWRGGPIPLFRYDPAAAADQLADVRARTEALRVDIAAGMAARAGSYVDPDGSTVHVITTTDTRSNR